MGASLGRFVPFFKEIKTPQDFGRSIKGKRIVGDHKKFGPFLFGIMLGTIFGMIKYIYLDQYMSDGMILRLSFGENLGLYFLMSFGALMGDTVKSIIKRRLNIAPHKAWVPFDEIDHSTLSMLLAVVFFKVPVGVMLTIIVVFFFLHLLTNLLAYLFKIKDVPY